MEGVKESFVKEFSSFTVNCAFSGGTLSLFFTIAPFHISINIHINNTHHCSFDQCV